MIDEMVHIRDFEMMVSETEGSKDGKGPMNIEIHWALADELITRLREAEKDAERCRRMYDSALREAKQQYEWRMEDSECGGNEVSEGLYMLECRVNRQAMKEKGYE